MKHDIRKYTKLLSIEGTPPFALYENEWEYKFRTGLIKRIKYDDSWNIVEIVDIDGVIYRKASGKKRGRPKKEQPSVE
jgi:hypothetical protein